MTVTEGPAFVTCAIVKRCCTEQSPVFFDEVNSALSEMCKEAGGRSEGKVLRFERQRRSAEETDSERGMWPRLLSEWRLRDLRESRVTEE